MILAFARFVPYSQLYEGKETKKEDFATPLAFALRY